VAKLWSVSTTFARKLAMKALAHPAKRKKLFLDTEENNKSK
jgi:hypothetical protein